MSVVCKEMITHKVIIIDPRRSHYSNGSNGHRCTYRKKTKSPDSSTATTIIRCGTFFTSPEISINSSF